MYATLIRWIGVGSIPTCSTNQVNQYREAAGAMNVVQRNFKPTVLGGVTATDVPGAIP